jgi:metallo-beta-lactamase family protein
LYVLHLLKKKGKLRGSPIFLDSPMSISAVEVYSRITEDHKLSVEECAGMCDVARYARTVEESKAIQKTHRPLIIISASGMATGGRVLHHLKKFAADPRNLILFAGYQAGGTRGSDLIRGTRTIKIHGETVSVNAEVAMLDGLSAHADQGEILGWLGALPRPPKNIFVTHGEPEGASALALAIRERFGWEVDVAQHMQEVEVP